MEFATGLAASAFFIGRKTASDQPGLQWPAAMAKPAVLVTGGLGYIGSHACVALAEAGYRPVIVDNLGNAKASVLERLGELTQAAVAFHRTDVRDSAALGAILE